MPFNHQSGVLSSMTANTKSMMAKTHLETAFTMESMT